MKLTKDDYDMAKTVDLVSIADYLGFTVKRVGHYHTIKEMDSIRIYNKRSWYRFSDKSGGSQIDFLKDFCNMQVGEATEFLLDFLGYSPKERSFQQEHKEKQYQERVKELASIKEEKREFILPEPNQDCRRLYAYLIKERGISKETVDYFVKQNLIYESKRHHNIIFKGNDVNGSTRFASMRGTLDYLGPEFVFKGDVPGNDKNYGFNTVNQKSDVLYVFEAGIDMLSFVDIYKDFTSNKLALGMLSDGPLERFLEEHSHIRKIGFGLDNDEPGRKATEELITKYELRGFEVKDARPKGGKDFNDYLKIRQSKKQVTRIEPLKAYAR